MLAFETLTLAPIDRNLVDKSLLTAAELAWLDAYHARVRETLTPLVGQEDRGLAGQGDGADLREGPSAPLIAVPRPPSF